MNGIGSHAESKMNFVTRLHNRVSPGDGDRKRVIFHDSNLLEGLNRLLASHYKCLQGNKQYNTVAVSCVAQELSQRAKLQYLAV